MLYFESNLTKQEEEARDIMVYLFNPVLKFVLMSSNPIEFYKYSCNSCRQTAILGAGYLRTLLPDYEINVFEGSFIEVNGEQHIPYIHAFITAKKDSRHLIIDLSRTTKRLLFSESYNNTYPEIEDYEDVIKIGQEMIDLDEMLETDTLEYFTRKKPKDLMETVIALMEHLKSLPQEKQFEFCDIIYSETTKLRR